MRMLQSGLLFLALGALAIPSRAADSDRLLPNDTNGIITINVKQLVDSALFKKIDDKFNIKDTIKKDSGAQPILDLIGLDPLRDIDRVVVAACRGEDGLLVVCGNFNKAKLEAAADEAAKDEKNGVKIIKEGGYTIYEKTEKGGKPAFAAILDGTTIVSSAKKEFVVEALDKKAGKKVTVLGKEISNLINRVDDKHFLTIVALSSVIPAPDLAEKLNSLVGRVDITDEVKVHLHFATKDEDSAKELEKTISGQLKEFKTFASIMANSDKNWALLIDVLGTLKVDCSQNNVTLKGEIGRDVIDRMLKKIAPDQ